MDSTQTQWSFSQKLNLYFIVYFVLLFILSLPSPNTFLPNTGVYLQPFFEVLSKWFGDNVLQIKQPYTHQLISDSTGLYIHTFLLLLISAMLSLLWSILDKKQNHYPKFQYWFRVFISYYLAFQLFKYGFNKVFKLQFYLPEPNILYSNVGSLGRDILYWSVMGVSYSYTVFAGILELIPAFLLLFRRTRLLGALIAFAVLVNVVMINVSFDISVKILSSFLLLLSVLIILPDAPNLYRFFILQKQGITSKQYIPTCANKKRLLVYSVGKTLVIGLLLLDVFLPYFKTQNFNDDLVARPFLHGAYQVEIFAVNQDTIPPLLTKTNRWKRFFIHRDSYFIAEDMREEMWDFLLQLNTYSQKMTLKETSGQELIFQYNYNPSDSLLILNGILQNDTIHIEARQINWQELPLLQKQTNWTIDDYFR
ncbi:MAG: hypothetical protein ACPGVB_13580 [Chitinophagales bacterium]